MIMAEKGKARRRAERFGQAASTTPLTVAEATGPALGAVCTQMRAAVQSISRLVQKAGREIAMAWNPFLSTKAPRRPPASKPCSWCSSGLKRPATHTVKWREPVVWWDEVDGTSTLWPAGRQMRMCEFHARIAERYRGVQAYRFRRLK